MAIKNFSYPLFFFLLAIVFLLPGVASPASAVDNVQGMFNSGDESNGGSWRVLQRSIGISAMHMQLLPGGRLIVSDGAGTFLSKISLPGGQSLKLDCTAHSVLFDLTDSSLCMLTLLTHNLGSAGALLPNDSLLQIGRLDDVQFSVRRCWSRLGGAIFQSTRRRTRLRFRPILPDGHVLIRGGQRQLSYGFVPRQENSSAVHFDFLNENCYWENVAEEKLLYSFLNGTLIVFANTRAVILDVSYLHVIRRLQTDSGRFPS